MTAGEMALLYNQELGYSGLAVVRMKGWRRSLWYDQTGLPWTPPSPNIPDLEAAAFYPGIGLFEASNVSVGRGAPRPFRWIGAPWMDAGKVAALLRDAGFPGVEFSTQDYAPSQNPYAGRLCRGVRLRLTGRGGFRPLDVFLRLNEALLKTSPRDFQWREDEARRMLGSEEASRWVASPLAADQKKLRRLFRKGAENFRKARLKFLLY